MSELFWPGDDHAGDLLCDESFLDGMVAPDVVLARARATLEETA